jgi:hypothetical protein
VIPAIKIYPIEKYSCVFGQITRFIQMSLQRSLESSTLRPRLQQNVYWNYTFAVGNDLSAEDSSEDAKPADRSHAISAGRVATSSTAGAIEGSDEEDADDVC